MSTQRAQFLDTITARAASCLAVEDAKGAASKETRAAWLDGAKLLETEVRVRKLTAETPPGADTVGMADNLAAGLLAAARSAARSAND